MRISDWSSDVCSSDLITSNSTPATEALTSKVTLSVSSSTIGSSTATASPGCFSHWATVASVTDSPRAGTTISVAISTLTLLRHCVRKPSAKALLLGAGYRSEEHTSELQSLMRISYAVFCLKKKNTKQLYHTYINYNTYNKILVKY